MLGFPSWESGIFWGHFFQVLPPRNLTYILQQLPWFEGSYFTKNHHFGALQPLVFGRGMLIFGSVPEGYLLLSHHWCLLRLSSHLEAGSPQDITGGWGVSMTGKNLPIGKEWLKPESLWILWFVDILEDVCSTKIESL